MNTLPYYPARECAVVRAAQRGPICGVPRIPAPGGTQRGSHTTTCRASKHATTYEVSMKKPALLRACAALSFVFAAVFLLYSPFVAGALLLAAGFLLQVAAKVAEQQKGVSHV